MMITWKQIERGIWEGTPDGTPPQQLIIRIYLNGILSVSVFVVDVLWEGFIVHRSERECLCAAKRDASDAVIRAVAQHGASAP